MILWLILAAMTAAAVVAVIWPFARRAGTAPSGSDMAVYRDQLAEIERDLAAGLVGRTEAEAARVEISGACLPPSTPPKPRPRPATPYRRRGGDVPLPLLRCWRFPLWRAAFTSSSDRRN